MRLRSTSEIHENHGHIMDTIPATGIPQFLFFKGKHQEPWAIAMGGCIEGAPSSPLRSRYVSGFLT